MAREIFIEIARLGDVVRVSAIDGETGAEASVLGPANAAKGDLELLATKKLERLLSDAVERLKPAKPGLVI